MEESPVTRASLLVRIRDGQDHDAWRQFYRIYAPLVYGFARQRGLQDADAADVMQDVLRSVARSAGRLEYDPQRGTFRGWLFTVTRNKVFNFLDNRRRRPLATGDSDAHQRLAQEPAADDSAEWWDEEYEKNLFAWAMDQAKDEFQPATWRAFELTALDDVSPQEVGRQLRMSVGAVYVAKSRVLSRLKALVRQVQEEEALKAS